MKVTHKQKVLLLLRDGKPHTHHELYRLGCVAHSRVSDLRKDGHTILQWRDGADSVYQLVGSPAVCTPEAVEAATTFDGDGQTALFPLARGAYGEAA